MRAIRYLNPIYKFTKRLVKYFFRKFNYSINISKHPIKDAFDLAALNKNENCTFIDIGANIGQGILLFDSLVKKANLGKVKVFGFEPIEENFNKLKENTSIVSSSLDIFKLGISDTDGFFDLYHSKSNLCHSINNSDVWKSRKAKKETIELKQLDTVIPCEKISGKIIIKIDVEGHEMEVLSGMKDFLNSKNTKILILEVGFNPEDKGHTHFCKIETFLFKYGFRCCNILNINKYSHPDWDNKLSIGFADALFIKN